MSLNCLPAETILHVFSFLHEYSLCSLACVSSQFNQLSEDDELWHALFNRKYNTHFDKEGRRGWKTHFKRFRTDGANYFFYGNGDNHRRWGWRRDGVYPRTGGIRYTTREDTLFGSVYFRGTIYDALHRFMTAKDRQKVRCLVHSVESPSLQRNLAALTALTNPPPSNHRSQSNGDSNTTTITIPKSENVSSSSSSSSLKNNNSVSASNANDTIAKALVRSVTLFNDLSTDDEDYKDIGIHMVIDSRPVTMSLHPHHCSEKVNVIVLCFSLLDVEALKQLVQETARNLRKKYGSAIPIVLVGTHLELCANKVDANRLRENRIPIVRIKEAEEVSTAIRAVRYVECSFVTGQQVVEVFIVATKAALAKKPVHCVLS